MSEQTIKVTLPDSIYDRVRKTAQSTSLSLEEVIKQSIILLLPAFESEIPPESRSNMAKLPLLNDIQLWKTANYKMDESRQIMLLKAEARRILAQRGHIVFQSIEQ